MNCIKVIENFVESFAHEWASRFFMKNLGEKQKIRTNLQKKF